MSSALLEVRGLSMSFGGLRAVENIALEVAPGEVFAVIGPNGAGKTTVFNCISGFYKPGSGRVRLDGKNVSGLPSHKMARKGLVRTFQSPRLFKKLTVLENLLVAQHQHLQTALLAGFFTMPSYRRAEKAALDTAHQWLDFMELGVYAHRPSGQLPYGHQRKLEIARCMAARPRVLLLDEPAAGLNPSEKRELQQLILQLRAQFGIAILFIEHDMSMVMSISDRILVMDRGQSIACGVPEEIRANPRVIKAYLGDE
jgi:branched-chain amino acid transport system ATP-binding protein